MTKIKRVFPGPTNGLINWMEQNFHEIDAYVTTFKMKDGTTMTVYDSRSYLEAIGLSEITKETIHDLVREDEFIAKK
jgi:hypothetical protein